MCSPDPLAQRATDNFAVHACWLPGRVPGMTVRTNTGLLAADSHTDCDTFNCILGARLPGTTAAGAIRTAIAAFGGRPFSWWVAPGDTPAGLGDLLAEAGLVAAESERAMARELADLPPMPATDLRIERATTPDAIGDFASVMAANWTPPDPRVHHFYQRATPALLRPDCPIHLYVGYRDCEAVTAAEGTRTDETVGLYNIATLASHRRRGYGSAMTLAPLHAARAQGATLAVIQASAEGAGVYRRIGFADFGLITEYKPA